jgi:hypothetical protein
MMSRIVIIRSDTFEGSVWLEGTVTEVAIDLAERLIVAGIARAEEPEARDE